MLLLRGVVFFMLWFCVCPSQLCYSVWIIVWFLEGDIVMNRGYSVQISRVLLVLFVCLLCVGEAFAEIKRVAVLEFRGVGVDQAVLLKLSDQARSAGLSVLSKEEYLMMTRENMREILSDMGKNADCMEGKCEVETGRNIGADIIVTGDILQMGKIYVLTLKLYETDRGVLLSTQEVEDPDLFNLKNKTHDQSIVLFQEGLGLKPSKSSIGSTGSRSAGANTPIQSGFSGSVQTEDWMVKGGSTAIVNFDSKPTGAVVLVDGQLLCTSTPCSKEISEGSHSIVFQKERYFPYESNVTVKNGDKISGVLEARFGYVDVSSVPSGVSLLLDTEKFGTTPITKKEVDAGVHTLRVEDPCYVGQEYRFQLSPGGVEKVTYPVVARESGIKVTVKDGENVLLGEVFVDGSAVGRSSSQLKVPLCSKELLVKVNDRSFREKLVLREHQVSEIVVDAGGPGPVLQGNGYKALLIPAGSFTMGCTSEQGSDCYNSEKPSHMVEISKAFYLMESEVTQELYEKVMGSNPSKFTGSKRPVEKVSWYDAVTFANKLSALEGRQKCYQISGSNVSWTKNCTGWRLPTDAEWEYAARGGQNYKYAGSNTEGDVAWYTDNSGSSTHDVCGKQKNGYGLCDMSGNVYEWVWDWKGSYSSGTQVDPQGPTSGSYRVLRGGSWGSSPKYLRVSYRYYNSPDYRSNLLGFRLGLSP